MGRRCPLLSKVLSSLQRPPHSELASSLESPWPPLSFQQSSCRGLGRRASFTAVLEMTSLLKCMNFYLQRTSCFHPKEVLCKGPEQGPQCMSLSNILPTAWTSSSWPVISCLQLLSKSCNLPENLPGEKLHCRDVGSPHEWISGHCGGWVLLLMLTE